MMNPNDQRIAAEQLQNFLRLSKGEFEKCLSPGLCCEDSAIRAHTVQNSRVLDMLVEDGHVIRLKMYPVLGGEPDIRFRRINRNEAMTFRGLCADHDREIFCEIDNNYVSLSNRMHLFLLSYRSVLRELHACMSAAVKIQSAYRWRVDTGKDPKDEPSEAGIFAVQRFIIAYETNNFKERFDVAFAKKDWRAVCHKVFKIHTERPCIAASALFSVDECDVDDDVLRIALNIFPTSEHFTYVIFSYLKSDAMVALKFLKQVIKTSRKVVKYKISQLVIERTENFVISPAHFDLWSEEKKHLIKTFYRNTLFQNSEDVFPRESCLFDT